MLRSQVGLLTEMASLMISTFFARNTASSFASQLLRGNWTFYLVCHLAGATQRDPIVNISPIHKIKCCFTSCLHSYECTRFDEIAQVRKKPNWGNERTTEQWCAARTRPNFGVGVWGQAPYPCYKSIMGNLRCTTTATPLLSRLSPFGGCLPCRLPGLLDPLDSIDVSTTA